MVSNLLHLTLQLNIKVKMNFVTKILKIHSKPKKFYLYMIKSKNRQSFSLKNAE